MRSAVHPRRENHSRRLLKLGRASRRIDHVCRIRAGCDQPSLWRHPCDAAQVEKPAYRRVIAARPPLQNRLRKIVCIAFAYFGIQFTFPLLPMLSRSPATDSVTGLTWRFLQADGRDYSCAKTATGVRNSTISIRGAWSPSAVPSADRCEPTASSHRTMLPAASGSKHWEPWRDGRVDDASSTCSAAAAIVLSLEKDDANGKTGGRTPSQLPNHPAAGTGCLRFIL